MFEFIRTHQRLMQFLLLILIVPPFAFFGIDGYKNFTDDPNAVANVAGHAITQQEFAQAQRDQLERQREMSRQLNVPFDPASMDSAAARAVTLDTLVSQRALTSHAVKTGVMVSDERLREFIMTIPAVQENGQFSKERYTALLAAQGMTPGVFEDRLRQDLAMQALNAGVAESSFSPRSVLAMVARAQDETREVQEFAILAAAFAGQVTVAPEAVKAYYDANQREFQVAAQMRAEYVALSVDALAATLSPPVEDIKAYYDQNAAKYRQDEQRQASHILLKFEEKGDRAALKALATDVLGQVRSRGADFAALAKKYSQDAGSAVRGGDLGAFGRGSMVKPFEDAVFGMKEGDVSDLVESEFGYHIIKLASVKPAKVKTLDEVRPEIEREWKRGQAQKRFSESAEGFTNTVYEQSDSLKPAADKFKLQVVATPMFARAAPPKELANPKLLERLFSDDAVKSKRNTEAVEVTPGTLVSARILEFKPQTIKSLDDARGEIIAQLTRNEAQAMARREGEAKLKAAQSAAAAVAFGVARTVSRVKPDGLSAEALRAVMAAPADKLPVVIGSAGSAGYSLFRVNKAVFSAVAEPARDSAIKGTLNRAQAEAEFSGYVESLKKAAKVVLMKENLEKKAN